MHTLRYYIPLFARILIAAIFLLSALDKIFDPVGNLAYMEAFGLNSTRALLYVAIGVEFLGSFSLIIGYKIRAGAMLLVFFTLVVSFTFHTNFADQIQTVLFVKNIAIIGGLLLIFTYGAGPIALDTRKSRVRLRRN